MPSLSFLRLAVLMRLCCAVANATPVVVTVTNAGGDAIAGASVSRLVNTGWTNQDGTLFTRQVAVGQTDAHGQISLDSDPAQRSAFLVKAPGKTTQPFGFWGCVPPTYRVSMSDASKPMSGCVIDSTGKPAAGITVHLRFADHRLLIPVQQYAGLAISFDCDTTTDTAGRFTLADPPTAVCYDVSADINGGRHLALMHPDAAEKRQNATAELLAGTFTGHVITAFFPTALPLPQPTTQPSLTISLRVLDAETNLPVKKVTVSPGGAISPDQGQFAQTFDSNAVELPGDHINWSFYDGAWSYFLRVSDDGYATASTPMIKALEKNVSLELKLNKAQPATIKVLNPDGKPAAGALVYLATPSVPLNVPLGDPEPYSDKAIATIGADGNLRFSPPSEAYRLAICDDAGSAEVDGASDKTKPITLTPWASGTVSAGPPGKRLAGLRLFYQTGYTPNSGCAVNWTGRYKTDQTGQVTLAKCRPGSFFTSVSLPATIANQGYSRFETRGSLNPGDRENWPLMTGKTTVKGWIGNYPGYEWSMLVIEPRGPAVELPKTINQIKGRQREWAASEAVRAAPDPTAKENLLSELYVYRREDGSFAVTGLRPGTYAITGIADPSTAADGTAPVTQTSPPPSLNWYFSVPASQPDIVDLGTITAESNAPAFQPGQIAPELAMKSLDDKPFDLKGERGHWVLLEFWGTWCGCCVAEEPTLKEVYQGWGQDGRLVMVSASVNDTVDQVRKYITANAIPWTQLLLGPGGKTNFPDQFDAAYYPTIMLISPEGKLVESHLRDAHLREVLQKYLGKPAAPTGEKTGR
jgi:thiol-disulfide isomerase/thioredoxin